MNWLELLKAAGVEIDAEKGEALNAALGAAVKEQIESSVMEATTGLKSKNDELLGKLKTQQTAAQEATAAAEAAARGQMSNDELNTSWQQKYSTLESDYKGQLDGVLGQMKQIKVDEVAMRLAAELSEYPEAILPHVRTRLGMDRMEDGSFKTTVLTDGKMSALTLDELKKEFATSPTLKPLIKVNIGGSTVTETTTVANSTKSNNYNDMSSEERSAYIAQKYNHEA